MAIFYPPPPHPQVGPVASTLPIPHVPIATAGDQPPLKEVSAVIAMTTTLASWPADQEPRLGQPNNTRLQNAATLPAPPTVIAIVPYVRLPAHLYATWDEPLEIEAVPTYVVNPANPDQPPRIGPQPQIAWLLRSWEPPPPPPVQLVRSIVPTFATALPPPIFGPRFLLAEAIIRSWDEPVRTPRQVLSVANVGTILPVYTPYVTLPAAITQAWAPVPNVPPRPVTIATATIPFTADPPRTSVLAKMQAALAWWPPSDLEPRLGKPNNEQQKIAPLTLIAGDAPTPRPPIVQTLLRIIKDWWPFDNRQEVQGSFRSAPTLPAPPPAPSVLPRTFSVIASQATAQSVVAKADTALSVTASET